MRRARCDWLGVRMTKKEEWKFATAGFGGQCVITAGIRTMQQWCVLNAASREMVRQDGHTCACSVHHVIFHELLPFSQ